MKSAANSTADYYNCFTKMTNKFINIKSLMIGFFNLIVIFSIAQNPVASFSTNQTSGCSPLTIQFTNTSVNATSCYWDFGNGNTSILTNPANVYINAGSYTVKVIAIAANGQKDSILSTNLITVSSNSVSDFYAPNTASCLDGNVFSFVNTSINSASCLWDFGDGATSTLQNPNHTYLTAGNHTLKLITYDAYGCPDLKTRINYIHVLPNPVSDFTVNSTIACSLNQVLNFSSTTAAANSWQWNFGDGTTSALQNPSHIYNNPGSFTVSLKTTNSGGCTNTLTTTDFIRVIPSQTLVFTTDTVNGCLPVEVTFSSFSSNAADWLWNFGDGSTSTEELPLHIYQNSGNYTISLTISTDLGCIYSSTVTDFLTIPNKAVSNFSINNIGGCSPLNVQFTNQSTNAVSQLWEFGDGSTSALQNPSYTYTAGGSYGVTLHSFNASGCEAIYQQPDAVVLELPVAGFSANFSPGCAPLTANFTNTSTDAVQWLWNFGDGNFSTTKNPAHTYNLPGDYDVSLIAFNSEGCTDTAIFISYIHVINTVGNYIPLATVKGCVPFNTLFSNITPDAVSWLWNFGDGSTSSLQNPSHTYISSGFYTVSLSVQLTGGCTQFYPNFRTFDVKGGQPEFTFLTQTLCAPFIVNFTGSTSANSSTSFWDFGDGTTSTLEHPVHSYANSGYFTVKYSTTTPEGCISTAIETNGLHFTSCPSNGTNTGGSQGGNNSANGGTVPPPLLPLTGCIPFTVHFNNTIAQTTAWFWDFGDGNTSTLQNPLHIYTLIGNYEVKLIAQHPSGLYDTVVYTDYIHASGINTNFTLTETSDCINTTLTCTGISPEAIAWHWDFDDGTYSILQNPILTIADSINNYAITLTTSNAQGCSGSISKNVLTTADNAAIWANTYSACKNQPVSFFCPSATLPAYL